MIMRLEIYLPSHMLENNVSSELVMSKIISSNNDLFN